MGAPAPVTWRRLWLVAAAGAMILAVVYAPALRGDFIWDDDYYVYENPLLRAPDGLSRIWLTTDFKSQFFPFTITVFRVAYRLWGLNTLGYHLLNVGVHALNAALVWTLLVRLGVPGAGLAAMIFALHPVQVESVAWITELKNLLSAMFYLLALLAYLRCEDGGRARWYAAAFALFLLGLASKTVACTLPGAILVVRWWRRKPIDATYLLRLVPFLLVGVGSGLFVTWYETSHIGTTGPEFALSFFERVLIAGRAPWFYAGKLILPRHLAFSYPRWELDAGSPYQWAWVVAAIAAAVLLWSSRERLGRGPAAGVALFAVVISPMLGFVNYYTMRYSFVADHYQYLACVGPIAVASGWTATAVARGEARRRPVHRAIGYVLAVGILLVLGLLSWQQAHAYRDREALWRSTLASNPGSWMGHNNLGNILLDRGLVDEALSHFETARRLNPAYADPYSNIGGVLVRQGRIDAGVALFRKAIAIEPTNADFRYNLGTTLMKAGRQEEAVATLEDVLVIDPEHAPAHNNLGILLAERGAVTQATEHYRSAVEIDPENPTFRENLGDALLVKGDAAAAATQYRLALDRAPDDPELHAGLADALGRIGRRAEAISEYRRVLTLAPDDAHAHYNLGVALGADNRFEEAIEQYREVLRLAPGDAAAENNLGASLVAAGRAEEAIEHFRRALAADPDDEDVRLNLSSALSRLGRVEEAAEVLREGMARPPRRAGLLNALAWLRATVPQERWRDGAEAVRLARRACALTAAEPNANYIDTLAAAYAAAGRFPDAVAEARRGIALASDSPELLAALRRRLALYESGRAFVDR